MAPHFLEASYTFPSVFFGGIDCVSQKSLCELFNVETYPTVHLFLPGSHEGIDYDGDHSPRSLVEFVEMHTSYTAARTSERLVEVNPVRWDRFVTSGCCHFLFAYTSNSAPYKHTLVQFQETAAAFDPDENITLGTLACDKFQELCQPLKIRTFPSLRLLKNGVWTEYTGERYLGPMVRFLNEECGTDRGTDGLLSDKAGTIATADALVPEFLGAEDKRAVIEKMKGIEGADVYVRVMERFLTNGRAALEKDVASMRALISERKGSLSSIDRVKMRYNVFVKFLGSPEPETRNVVHEEDI
jgi:protein disulfide-isomerase A6